MDSDRDLRRAQRSIGLLTVFAARPLDLAEAAHAVDELLALEPDRGELVATLAAIGAQLVHRLADAKGTTSGAELRLLGLAAALADAPA